jgi:hypothetical protein
MKKGRDFLNFWKVNLQEKDFWEVQGQLGLSVRFDFAQDRDYRRIIINLVLNPWVPNTADLEYLSM